MLKTQRKTESGAHEEARESPGLHEAQAMPLASSPRPLGVAYRSGPALGLAPRLQPKLQMGRVDDPYEREADQVADHVSARESAPPVSHLQPGGLSGQRSDDDADDGVAQAKCSACESEQKVQAKPEAELAQASCEACDAVQKEQAVAVPAAVSEPQAAPAPAPAAAPAARATPPRSTGDEATPEAGRAVEGGDVQEDADPRAEGASGADEEHDDDKDEPVVVAGAVDEDASAPSCNAGDAPAPRADDDADEGGADADKPQRLNPAADIGCGDGGGKEAADAGAEAAPEGPAGAAKKSCGSSASSGSGGEEDAADGPDTASPASGERPPVPDQSVPSCGEGQAEASKEPDPAAEEDQGTSGGSPAGPQSPKASAACAAVQKRSLNDDVHDGDRQDGRRSNPGGAQLFDAEQRIKRRGEGEPLPSAVRGRIESSVGLDLGGVRVHTDSNAQAASKALRAKAFTHRSHIFVGPGQSKHDVGLMAHETTHVLQQGGIERKPAESEAKALARRAATEHPPEATRGTAGKHAEGETNPHVKPPAATALASPATTRPIGALPGVPGLPPGARDKPATPMSATATATATAKEPPDKGPADPTKTSDTPEQTVHPPLLAQAVRQTEAHASSTVAARKHGAGPAAQAATVPGQQTAGNTHVAGAAEPPAAAPQPGARASAGSGASESVEPESAPAAKRAAEADPQADPRFQGTIKRLHGAALRERDHVEPDEKVRQAQGAVKAPADEPRSRAANDKVADMAAGADAAPAPREKSFEDVLNEKLEEIRPKNMEQTLEFRESGAAGKLKSAVGAQVKQQQNETIGPLQKATVAPLKTERYPNPKEKKLEPDLADPAQRSLHAEDVLPQPKGEQEVSVDKDRDEADRLMKDNDLDEEQLKRANEPQFTAVVQAREKLEENSAKVVPAYRQEEANLLNKGAKELATTSAHALGGMRGKRRHAKDKVLKGQDAARQKEEEERKTVAGNINSKFSATQSAVKGRLDGLDAPVGTLFDLAERVARQKFEATVDHLMTAYKDDRYSGVRGKLAWGWDKLTGMPREVDQFFVEGTKVYIASMKEAFRNIASFVDAQLALAKADITKGKKDIGDYLAGLKGKQKEYGDTAFTAIEGDFAALESSVQDKKQNLAGDLVQKYKQSRTALDERIDELKAENAGLLSKLVAFVKKVVAVLKKLKDLAVMLLKVGGSVLRGIVKDPTGFLGNLVDAVKSGFAMFGEHIGRHLKDALISFVTGSMRDVGVNASGEGGPGGLGGILLQVLGLSPQNLKDKLARKLGLREPSVLEKAWTAVKTLLADGASALWSKIKEFAGDIREKVSNEIRDWIGSQIVKAGLAWIVSLFSPASALLRALKMIYDVVSFFVNNLDRIIDLVDGLLKSVSAVVAGNIAGAARMIESAAAKGLSVLLGFLAALLGVSGIGDKIRAIVQRIRSVVERAVDRILDVLLRPFKWIAHKAAPLVGRGKAALQRGKAAVQRAGRSVARFVFPRRNFSGGGESHTLHFAGEGENAPLMVASTPRTLLKFVGELRQRPENQHGKGKEALDQTGQHFAAIRRLQRELRRRPTKVGQQRIDKEMAAIASILREILIRGGYATKSNPLPLVWSKPPSEHYQPLFLGPVLAHRNTVIPQKMLKSAYDKGTRMDERAMLADRLRSTNEARVEAWEKKNMPIDKFLPHQRKRTPDGEHTLGLTPNWHIAEGRELRLPSQKPPPSPGGGLINSALKPYGYDPGTEARDGDHVVEMQIGGKDQLENLWPLDATVNRASGRNIRAQEFQLEGGVSISMGQLKELARRRKNPRSVWLKISRTS